MKIITPKIVLIVRHHDKHRTEHFFESVISALDYLEDYLFLSFRLFEFDSDDQRYYEITTDLTEDGVIYTPPEERMTYRETDFDTRPINPYIYEHEFEVRQNSGGWYHCGMHDAPSTTSEIHAQQGENRMQIFNVEKEAERAAATQSSLLIPECGEFDARLAGVDVRYLDADNNTVIAGDEEPEGFILSFRFHALTGDLAKSSFRSRVELPIFAFMPKQMKLYEELADENGNPKPDLTPNQVEKLQAVSQQRKIALDQVTFLAGSLATPILNADSSATEKLVKKQMRVRFNGITHSEGKEGKMYANAILNRRHSPIIGKQETTTPATK